jgi:hypothetical protein
MSRRTVARYKTIEAADRANRRLMSSVDMVNGWKKQKQGRTAQYPACCYPDINPPRARFVQGGTPESSKK